MDRAAQRDGSGRREFSRWSACFVAAAVLHAGGALALFVERDRGEVSDSIPAVLMDFVALPTPDAPLRDVAPGLIEQRSEERRVGKEGRARLESHAKCKK